MNKPHTAFTICRADEIAETWDGVGAELYSRLWDLVADQAPIPNREDSGPADHIGHENLASHWHKLTAGEQRALNALAARRDAELGIGTDAGADPFAIFADEPVPAAPGGHDMRGRLTTPIDAELFMLAGKSTVTLVSTKTGTRFTYRISATPDRQAHFVGVLSGPDNNSDYQYLGRIARGMFWQGRKTPKPGDVSRDAPSAKAFAWAWQAIVRGGDALPAQLEIWHEGRCGRCGRKLTVPASVASGFGPECIGKLG